MLNGLDLFSGIGGLSVALKEWVRPIAYCEIDAYCQGVLLNRMANSQIATAPIWDDVRTFPARLSLPVDTLYGGFPCQDISVAGRGKGLEGERSGLFFEIVRLSKEIKPRFIFLENVPAITSRGGLRVVREIAEMGYDCRWCVISAASVGALHRRERWFLLAYSKHDASYGIEERGSSKKAVHDNEERKNPAKQFEGSNQSRMLATESIADPSFSYDSESMSQPCKRQIQQLGISIEPTNFPNSSSLRCDERPSKGIHSERQTEQHEESSNDRSKVLNYWENTEPPVCGVAHGIPNRVDRIRALGNSVVPSQAKEAFKILMGFK